MRRFVVAFPLALSLSAGHFLAAQEKPEQKPKTPRSGDTIVVRGCLRGSMLESTEIGLAEAEDRQAAAHTFQLKGKKDRLRELRARYDGYHVEIRGVLKSNLMDNPQRGTRVGNTRIVIGVESATRGPSMQGASEPLPALEVKSFEGFETSCRR